MVFLFWFVYCFLFFFWVRRSVSLGACVFPTPPAWDVCSGAPGSLIRAKASAGTSSTGRRASPTFARARGGIRADAWYFVCVCVCVCRVASSFRRVARAFVSFLSFVRFFTHARAPWDEWARHSPVDHRRRRATTSFGRVKIVRSIARARTYRCTSPRERIAAAVGARDRANPSFEGTSSREIRSSISSACTPGWSRGRACRAGGF